MATDASKDAHGAADAAHAATESAGMPQLDFSTYANQIFWLLVAMVAIYLILSRVALPRIAAVLADRQGTITKDLASAEELKQQAVEAEEAYNKALADAKAEAAKIVADAKAEIQAELDDATAKADAEIAARAAESEKAITAIRDGALESISVVARETATEIVSALGQTTDEAAIGAAVDAQLKG